jgi:hypothetical protein
MLRIKRKGHHRKGYSKDVRPGVGIKIRRIAPTQVEGSTFLAKDRGHRGRTPKTKRWTTGVENIKSGWRKEQPAVTRRMLLAGIVQNKGLRAAVGEMNWLANVNPDRITKILAKSDSKWLSAKFKKK